MTDAPTAARTLSGPFGTRFCTVDATGYVWTEELSGDSSVYLDATALAGQTITPGTARVTPNIPSVVEGLHARWYPVPSSGLLFDKLFSAPTELAGNHSEFVTLGGFLADVHRQQTDPSLPDRADIPAWLRARPDVGEAVSRISGELLGLAGPFVARWAVEEPALDARTFVHGRFSTALFAIDGRDITVLGWREAGLGDPMQDLGYLLGELAEAISATGASAAEGRLLAEAFVSAYEQARGAPLTNHERRRLACRTVRRMVDHMAIHVVAYEQVRGPSLLLRRADAVLATLFSELTEGL